MWHHIHALFKLIVSIASCLLIPQTDKFRCKIKHFAFSFHRINSCVCMNFLNVWCTCENAVQIVVKSVTITYYQGKLTVQKLCASMKFSVLGTAVYKYLPDSITTLSDTFIILLITDNTMGSWTSVVLSILNNAFAQIYEYSACMHVYIPQPLKSLLELLM